MVEQTSFRSAYLIPWGDVFLTFFFCCLFEGRISERTDLSKLVFVKESLPQIYMLKLSGIFTILDFDEKITYVVMDWKVEENVGFARVNIGFAQLP